MLKLMSLIPTTSVQPQRGEEAETLLKHLLECVQDCQKKFGGKPELATEFDICIRNLCAALEAVLLFGLKSKNSQVEHPSFWSFVHHHLTKHEQERFEVLKQIWTDTGRERAWIRAALNEHSLERYFHMLLGNKDILREYYEPGSILYDEEKNSMLPNMAAGLNSILFAIGIDKPELNSGSSNRGNRYLSKKKPEPIIEAPIREKEIGKTKRVQKVARQFISFDNDDSPIATSVSSSGSSASTNTSLGYSSSSNNRSDSEQYLRQSSSKMENGAEKHSNLKNLQVDVKLSKETSESLSTVAQEKLGELTPVYVQVDEHFEPFDLSDQTLEPSTDNCEVLNVNDSKNKEVSEKINILARENETLKKQVKGYIEVIQMLKTNDGEIENILENLDIEEQPNYKMEAKMFEKKLVQVAEMHAELMDFNVALQQKLYQNEMLLAQLKTEVKTLRSLPSADDTSYEGMSESVQIWIPSAFLKGVGSSAYHVYQIFMRAGNDEWNVYRRYAQFHAFHSDLKKLDPSVEKFDFPPKRSLNKKDSAVVEDRRKRLQTYLRTVIAHWPELANCNSRFLLEQHLSFFKCQGEEILQRNTHTPRRSSVQPANIHSGL